MRITPYDPFREIDRMFDDLAFGFAPLARRGFEPAMDVYQTEADFVVELHVPKIDAKQIKVSVEDGILKIEGEHAEEKEDKREYFRKEIRRGSFVRMIALPVPVKEDEAKAVFEHGILKVSLPKVEAKQAKEVKIEVR
ncbi:MAG: Hsp20/alpha crystallin family protein [Candidatus Paceibacterota bacterium]|nr:MAG: Hsp20/alpha crystallin family protein [Candidatus Paceibacterota bacterium]